MKPTRAVPCNGCTRCCWHEAIFLHAEEGDDIHQYRVTMHHGRPILEHKPDGSCFYLGESGCSIHERRPAVCRTFDCRDIVTNNSRSVLRRLVHQGAIRNDVLAKGRELLGRVQPKD